MKINCDKSVQQGAAAAWQKAATLLSLIVGRDTMSRVYMCWK